MATRQLLTVPATESRVGGVPRSRWFASIDIEGAPASAGRLVDQIEGLLDQLEPTRLDPGRSTVRTGSSGTDVFLAHSSEPIADIQVSFSDGSGTMWALNHHDEFYSLASDPSDQWTDDIVESVAEVLRRHYVIEVFTWRGRDIRTRITTDTSTATSNDYGWGLVALLVVHSPLTDERWTTAACATSNASHRGLVQLPRDV